MSLKITSYDALCNLGNNIDTIYENALTGNNTCFDYIENYIPNNKIRVGLIKNKLPKINDKNFNIKCNQVLLANLDLLQDDIKLLLEKYDKSKIGIICAGTNSGVNEYEFSKNSKHFELGNSAQFIREYLNLTGYYTTVSTACSSGTKAFSISRDLMNNSVIDAAIVICVDTLSKVPVFGFNALEVLSSEPCTPFCKNRTGMNIGEASAIFILEKAATNGISILGIGESSDVYHSTTPDPKAKEAINAINMALKDANINSTEIDYINAHGTGTIANDLMEAAAISTVFGETVPVSSTKPLTGHCLGAAAGIEIALCCKLLDNFSGKLYPNSANSKFDMTLPKINIVSKSKTYKKCKICMSNSFGFGGTNAIIILGKDNG